MKTKKTLIKTMIAIAVILFSCHDDDKTVPDLRTYLDRFEQEATKLGYDFDLSNVQIVYTDEIVQQGKPYCGWGYPDYNGTGLRRIEISNASYCKFADRSDIERENLVFHEVGHAFLQRVHDDANQCNGTPLSLMNSIVDGFTIYDDSDDANRTYYISELIDPTKANDKCIKYNQDLKANPILYTYTKADNQWTFESVKGAYSGAQTDDNKLTISYDGTGTPGDNGYWYKQFQQLSIPECSEVTFKVRLNSTMLKGPGAAIAVRVYDAALKRDGAIVEQSLFLTNENVGFSGELVNYAAELTIPCFTRKTLFTIPFVVLLAGTQGKVDFDQIQIIVKVKS